MKTMCRIITSSGAVAAFLLAVFSAPLAVYSQENTVIDRFLENQRADIDIAIYLSMLAGGRYDGDDISEAKRAFEAGFRVPAFQDGYLSAGDLSLIIGQTMDIPPGVMSSIFPIARYRFRDLKSYGIIPAGVLQSDRLTSEGVLILIGNAIAFQERYQ